jgi:hypothetical protein
MKIGHFEPILALDHPGFYILTRFLHREPVSTSLENAMALTPILLYKPPLIGISVRARRR